MHLKIIIKFSTAKINIYRYLFSYFAFHFFIIYLNNIFFVMYHIRKYLVKYIHQQANYK